MSVEAFSEDGLAETYRPDQKENFFMYHVYLIESKKDKSKKYVGFTTNMKQRLETHNSGGSIHTKLDRPWKLVMFLTFMNEKKALAFEKYLKNHAGRAFAAKRFW